MPKQGQTCARKVVCRLCAVIAYQRELLGMLSQNVWLKDHLQLHLFLPVKGKCSRANLEWPQLHQVILDVAGAVGGLPFPADMKLPCTASVGAGDEEHLHRSQLNW